MFSCFSESCCWRFCHVFPHIHGLSLLFRICFQGHKPRWAHISSSQGEGLCGCCNAEKSTGELKSGPEAHTPSRASSLIYTVDIIWPAVRRLAFKSFLFYIASIWQVKKRHVYFPVFSNMRSCNCIYALIIFVKCFFDAARGGSGTFSSSCVPGFYAF